MPANNRFSDNPIRDPNLSPEQVERIEKRNEALRIYRETGDRGPAVEAGLFPPKPTTKMTYKGTEFMLQRPVSDGPTVDVSLVCAEHEHDAYTISIFDGNNRWAFGRKAEGGKVYHGGFKTGVRRCADMLIRECTAIVEVDDFFSQPTIFCVLEGDEPKSLVYIDLDAMLKSPKSKTDGETE